MIPKNAKRIPLRPLALGEATGHHHSLYAPAGVAIDDVAEMYEFEDKTYLRITAEGVTIGHQEHYAHQLPVGEYAVSIQTEVTDWGRREVVD